MLQELQIQYSWCCITGVYQVYGRNVTSEWNCLKIFFPQLIQLDLPKYFRPSIMCLLYISNPGISATFALSSIAVKTELTVSGLHAELRQTR